MKLVPLLLALWNLVAPGASRLGGALPIAQAIESAITSDPRPPVFASLAEDAAVMAFFAIRESWLNVDAVGDGGRANGPWQEHGARGLPLDAQAKRWLSMLHEGARSCPEHPTAVAWGACHARDSLTGRDVFDLAARREARAHELLVRVLAGVAERQAP